MSGIITGNVRGLSVATVTFNPASVAANTTAEQDMTVPGVSVGDFVDVRKPTLTAGLGVVNARAKSANVVAVTFSNNTGSPIDAPSEAYLVMCIKSDAVLPGVTA